MLYKNIILPFTLITDLELDSSTRRSGWHSKNIKYYLSFIIKTKPYSVFTDIPIYEYSISLDIDLCEDFKEEGIYSVLHEIIKYKPSGNMSYRDFISFEKFLYNIQE